MPDSNFISNFPERFCPLFVLSKGDSLCTELITRYGSVSIINILCVCVCVCARE